jgi:secreted trypsin-like serine protease
MPLQNGDKLYVTVGDHDRSTTQETQSQRIEIGDVIDHPGYDDNTMDNDISLLKVRNQIVYSNTISPVCLPFKFAQEEFANENIVASGWGTTQEGGSVSNTLNQVSLPVLTTEQCRRYMPGQVTDNMICTYQPGKDTCQGDSGGSIDLLRSGRYYEIGVVSWGYGCARENYPGVYAKVTKYLDWIRQTAQGETFCNP